MPEYLAPGVYVEETSFRPKTIEGVSTSTAAFVGPTRFGPAEGEPELLTSFADFERIYGGLDPLRFEDTGDQPNYLAQAIRAFFEEGGRRCYVARAYTDASGGGRSSTAASLPEGALLLTARHPGQAGDMRVTLRPLLSKNVLVRDPVTQAVALRGVSAGDVVQLERAASSPSAALYQVVRSGDELRLEDGDGAQLPLDSLTPPGDVAAVLTAEVAIERPIIRPRRPDDRYGPAEVLSDLKLDPQNPQSVAKMFSGTPESRRIELTVPLVIELAVSLPGASAVAWAEALFGAAPTAHTHLLRNGSDGNLPEAQAYRGPAGAGADGPKSGLYAIEELEDVSIVAAPGYSRGYAQDGSRVLTIQQHLINHCTNMRYRIAVLDAPDQMLVSGVRNYRAMIDSKYAAMYYPWVTVLDPITQRELDLPPSGFVAGIYARNDVEHGVQKAPANEVVRLALRFETSINKAQQDVLNPEGVNCFRFFEGRGNRLWGARTATSDGEWKYVNLRRYFAYLERSIDVGTQVFVFDSNGERLWDNVRRTISSFLFAEWKAGRLMGATPEEAFFVRCDRGTMSQNDIDNGRLICEIGVAPLRPAEFVIFRIGQKLLETVA